MPATTSAVYSEGELPRANPSIFLVFRSPPSKVCPPNIPPDTFTANSIVPTGTISFAPFDIASTMVEEARKISITTVVFPVKKSSSVSTGEKSISSFISVIIF